MRLLLISLVLVAACCPPEAAKPPITPVVTAPPPPTSDAATTPPPPSGPPVARTVDVVDHEFGLDLPDPYRWMEGTTNAETTTWLRAHADHAATELARIPGRDKLHARIRELGVGVNAVFAVQLAGGRLFHKLLPANEQLAKLAVRDRDGTTRVLVDPTALSTADTHASIQAYSASPDGTLVSYVIATGGGELGQLHVMDVATGKDLPDVVDRIWGEGAASWLPDSKRFFYTQMAVPAPGVDPMTNQISRLHVLGTPATSDVTILGREPGAMLALTPEEWPGLWVPPGTTWVIAWIGGAHNERRLALAKLSELDLTGTGKTPWKRVADYADGVESMVIHGDRLYVVTFKGAPNRKLVSVPLAKPELATARVDLAEDPDAPLDTIADARDALYVLHRVKGRARLSRWVWNAKAPTPITLPVDGWAPDLASDSLADGLTFQLETWLAPGSYFAFDPKTQKVTPAGLASTSTADFSTIAADEVEATSPDGTLIPLTILHRKDLAHDGSHPTLLYAYGGYGAVEYPGFGATKLAWLERGGVYAIAHVRGGGEKGRRWQDAGSREHKLVGVGDVVTCAEYVIAQKLTSSAHLAVQGISMGGVLIGRTITLRPDLFAAANLASGIVNPLRILVAENGANQKTELGDPATEAGYRSIAEMDPYVHVAPNTAYPAVIFTVGVNDHRVAPWMSAKMAARLLASSTSGKPILVRIDRDAGHGLGSTRDQTFAERADVWSFLLAALGDPEFAPRQDPGSK
jgi:prolyl oligopeptidase